MLGSLVVVLFVLWLIGVVRIPGFTIPNWVLFIFNGRSVRLIDLLIFGVVIWITGLLPQKLQPLAWILVIIWLLIFFRVIQIPFVVVP